MDTQLPHSADDPHCELAVSFPLVCVSHHDLAVSYLWFLEKGMTSYEVTGSGE